jgi:hypothetical protein
MDPSGVYLVVPSKRGEMNGRNKMQSDPAGEIMIGYRPGILISADLMSKRSGIR